MKNYVNQCKMWFALILVICEGWLWPAIFLHYFGNISMVWKEIQQVMMHCRRQATTLWSLRWRLPRTATNCFLRGRCVAFKVLRTSQGSKIVPFLLKLEFRCHFLFLSEKCRRPPIFSPKYQIIYLQVKIQSSLFLFLFIIIKKNQWAKAQFSAIYNYPPLFF